MPAGELLYVPGRTLHQARSLGPTVSLGAKFLGRGSLEGAKAELYGGDEPRGCGEVLVSEATDDDAGEENEGAAASAAAADGAAAAMAVRGNDGGYDGDDDDNDSNNSNKDDDSDGGGADEDLAPPLAHASKGMTCYAEVLRTVLRPGFDASVDARLGDVAWCDFKRQHTWFRPYPKSRRRARPSASASAAAAATSNADAAAAAALGLGDEVEAEAAAVAAAAAAANAAEEWYSEEALSDAWDRFWEHFDEHRPDDAAGGAADIFAGMDRDGDGWLSAAEVWASGMKGDEGGERRGVGGARAHASKPCSNGNAVSSPDARDHLPLSLSLFLSLSLSLSV